MGRSFLLALTVVGLLTAAAPAAALERMLTLSFTKEILYSLASDNSGESYGQNADKILGLSPAVSRVIVRREGERVAMSFITAAEGTGNVSFVLVFDKMDLYKLAVAKADVTGIMPIMARLKSRDPHLKVVDYRFDSRYAIIDVTLDIDKDQAERQAEEAKKPPPPPPPEKPPAQPKAPPVPEKKPEIPKPPPPPEKKPEIPKAPPVPEKKPEPESPTAKMVGAGPVVDGNIEESVWNQVVPFKLEARGPAGVVPVTFQAAHDGRNIYLALSWPDSTKSDKHKPWIWNGAKDEYESSPQLEDGVAVQVADKDIPACMTSGRDYQADLWHWRAGRTDPSGFAEDEWLTVSTKKLPQANTYQSGAGGNVWIKIYRDAGTLPYKSEIAVGKGADELPRYLPQPPGGSMADVRAKGRWERGRWTVELARSLITGAQDDLPLVLGRTYNLSVAVFDASEWQEHAVSKTFTLNLE